MDDVLKAMHDSGFEPTVNQDEDFPAIEGEYGVTVRTLRPWVNEETDIKEAYMLQVAVSQTLSGETADGRLLTHFYRIAGNGFNGEAITNEQVANNLRRLCNDLFTLGIELDRSSTEALEASFANAIGAAGFARAWKSLSPKDQDRHKQENHTPQTCTCRPHQYFRIKTEKDLRKGSQDTAAGKTARAPF